MSTNEKIITALVLIFSPILVYYSWSWLMDTFFWFWGMMLDGTIFYFFGFWIIVGAVIWIWEQISKLIGMAINRTNKKK